MQEQELTPSEPEVTRKTVPADFGGRFVAWLVEGLIFAVPTLILVLLVPITPVYIAALVGGIVYSVHFWMTSGRTAGKTAIASEGGVRGGGTERVSEGPGDAAEPAPPAGGADPDARRVA
jgi:hypothetical protein